MGIFLCHPRESGDPGFFNTKFQDFNTSQNSQTPPPAIPVNCFSIFATENTETQSFFCF